MGGALYGKAWKLTVPIRGGWSAFFKGSSFVNCQFVGSVILLPRRMGDVPASFEHCVFDGRGYEKNRNMIIVEGTHFFDCQFYAVEVYAPYQVSEGAVSPH